MREHAHGNNDEIIYVLEGQGKAVVGEEHHAMVPGTTIFLGKSVKHMFINEGDGELKFIATILPAGLEDYFEQVGRPRTPDEPTPEPFAGPENVLEIERNTVFKDPK